MGNEQSSEMSPEAREAEMREREAIRAATNADMDRRKEEAKKRILAERAAHAASLEKTIANEVVARKVLENAEDTAPGFQESPNATTPHTKDSIDIDSSEGESSDASIWNQAKNAAKRAVEIESASEDDDDWNSRPQQKRKKKARKSEPTPALYKATVKELAESGITVTGSTADIDNDVMLRMKKCLERANHSNTPEAEAKRALLLASRLMRQYNVTQAEVLAHEPPDAQRQYAGQSVVSITRVDGDQNKIVRHGGFVDIVCHAMNLFFNCKHYSTAYFHGKGGSQSHFELTFYGIAENTVAAALALEMTYNLISEWARPYKGIGGKNSYCLGIGDELQRMAVKARAAEEAEAKKKEKEKLEADALAAREKQELDERQAQVDRLASLPEGDLLQDSVEVSGPSDTRDESLLQGVLSKGASDNPIWLDSDTDTDESDDEMTGCDSGFADEHNDDDEDTFMADFEIEHQDDEGIAALDKDVDNLVNRSRPLSTQIDDLSDEKPFLDAATGAMEQVTQGASNTTVPSTDQREFDRPSELEEPGTNWASHMQLVTFRETAMNIAEEHAKTKGLKLRAGKKRSNAIRDPSAYKQGVKDGKKIDVHRRTIKE